MKIVNNNKSNLDLRLDLPPRANNISSFVKILFHG